MLSAGEDAKESAAESNDEDGFVSLFNGKDLTGWKISDNGKWKVEDGSIVANGPRSHLFTEEDDYKNFIFKAEVKTTPGSNSGIYFHTKFQDEGWPEIGHESQVNVTHTDPVKTGSLYNVVRLFKTPTKDNQWWTQTIKVEGDHVTIMVDDEIVVDFIEPPGLTRGRKLSSGAFAFQAHDPESVAYFRNIRVKRLPE